MHSKDRTLIASLGFQDPDRGSARHSLACQYLSRPETAERVVGRVREATGFGQSRCGRAEPVGWRAAERLQEVAIVKGEDKYRSVVGFWDVVYSMEAQFLRYFCAGDTCGGAYTPTQVHKRHECRGSYKFGDPDVYPVTRNEPHWEKLYWDVFVEVKTTKIDVADIGRQLALYAEFTTGSIVAALTWRLSPDEHAALTAKGIVPIWLGPPFDAYCEARAKSVEVVDEEPL